MFNSYKLYCINLVKHLYNAIKIPIYYKGLPNMARWRDTKKGKFTKKNIENEQPQEVVLNQSCSPLFRIKAFITDMFMIMMPIMYITTYLILDGKDSFQGSEMARWITMGLYGLIVIIFWVKKGQTPGFKAYDIILVNDKDKQTLSLVTAT